MSFLIFILGLLLGWKLREYTAVRKFNKMLDSKKPQETVEKVNKVQVKIERNGKMFYLYNLETNEFLTQGYSKEEIQENLKKRFKNVDMAFHATVENIKEVGFK